MSSNDNPRGGQGSTALRNRRTTSSSSSSEKVISTEDLREYFECPICFNVPRSPPIYACGVGHMICRVCRPKLKNCPTCRMPYPPPGTQNHRLYFAEKLLEERIPIACMFAPFGCDVELTGGEIKRHEEACPCQPLPCPLKGCSALVSRGKLKTHTDKCEYRLIRITSLIHNMGSDDKSATATEEGTDVNSHAEDELDALSMQLLILSQDLVSKKLELEGLTKQGHLAMAQARNAMGGPHSVSRTQHPDTDLRASIKVVGEECLMQQTDASGTVRYQHYRIDSTHEETTTSRNSEPEGPRQRKNQIENLTSSLGNVNIGEEKRDEKETPQKKSDSDNPLKWFGILVPSSLKQSQKCFQKAVERSVECANIQNEINGVIARRKFLLKKKQNQT